MLPIDASFRRGLGLMFFGLWLSLVGIAFILGLSLLGFAAWILGIVVVVSGGAFVVYGHDVMARTSRPR